MGTAHYWHYPQGAHLMNDTFTDRQAILDNVSAIGRCIDDRDWDRLGTLFTDDATVTTPGGTALGREALVEQARSRHTRYLATQHLTTNIIVEIDGDRAAVRANLQTSFAKTVVPDPEPYQTGGVNRMGAVRTPDGWKFTSLEGTQVWTRSIPLD